jgi:hypothetical protein
LIAAAFGVLVASGVAAAKAAAAPLPPQIHTAYAVPSPGEPVSVATLPGGGFVYVDSIDDEVVEVSAAGTATVIAGNSTSTDAPDGTLATQSGLDGPVAVAPVPGGGFLITEYNGAVVRMISPGTPATATITTIAGTGTNGNNGSSGPATSIDLNYPSGAEPTADGGVLIADTGNDSIGLVSSGYISTIAGAGSGGCDDTAGFSCEGLAADAVDLHDPVSVSPIQGGAGGYLISEADPTAANAVRRVSQLTASGTFTTIAGTPGQPFGYGGDGGPATAALLSAPQQVLSTPDGGVLIADSGNERIRQVSPAGTITTVAGDGAASYSGDGGVATSAALNSPYGVSLANDSDGALLIADASDPAIREVTIPPVTTIALSRSAAGRKGWYLRPVKATITTTEGATTRCELDPSQPPPVFDAMPPSCLLTSRTAITGNGAHTLYAASVNAADDKELPVSVTFGIDTTTPTLTCARRQIFPFSAAHERVSATVTDSVSGPLSPIVYARANTSRAGRHWAKLRGESVAGAITSVRCAYTVLPAKLKPRPQIAWTFALGGGFASVLKMVVSSIPPNAAVNVSCAGAGCPFGTARNVTGALCNGQPCTTRRIRRRRPWTVDLTSLLTGAQLASSDELAVSVTAPNTTGRVWLFGFSPRFLARTSCLAPGSWTPGVGCSTKR